jgi:quercetin dioxygenase-like cupin family protein
MPIEIRRFGVGYRRPHGPEGTVGVTGQVIHSDETGTVAELAFARGARIEPHANPNHCWFVVIEGGGWVAVGEERTRVAAGEAVAWPPDVVHAAWTEQGEMRAFVVEFAPAVPATVVEAQATRLIEGGDTAPVERGDGALRVDPDRVDPSYDPAEGEPR